MYIGLGPTELTAHALCGLFDGATTCIGFPASNVKAYIINSENGHQAPINVVGELYVTGENVSNGYLNHPELSREHFVDNPIDTDSSWRCYRTGDFAKVSIMIRSFHAVNR